MTGQHGKERTVNNERTWHMDTERLGPGYITNGTVSLKTWVEAIDYLSVLEQAKADAERDRDEAQKGGEAWVQAFASFRQKLRGALHSFYPTNPMSEDSELIDAVTRLISEHESAEIALTNANTRNLQLEAQIAAAVKERDEAQYGADEVGRIAMRWKAKEQRYREALEAIRDLPSFPETWDRVRDCLVVTYPVDAQPQPIAAAALTDDNDRPRLTEVDDMNYPLWRGFPSTDDNDIGET